MHLLPQSFVFQTPPSSSQGRLREQRHSSSQPLFNSFEKPAAPPPAAGFFVFRYNEFRPYSRLPCFTGFPDFERIEEPWGSRDEIVSASSRSGRARSFASSQSTRIQVSVSS